MQSYEVQLQEYEKNKIRKHHLCGGSGVVSCCGKPSCRSCHGKGTKQCGPCKGTGLQFPNLVKPSPPGSTSPAPHSPARPSTAALPPRPKPQTPAPQQQQHSTQGDGWGSGWGSGGSGGSWGGAGQSSSNREPERTVRNRDCAEIWNLKYRDEGPIRGETGQLQGIRTDGKYVPETAVTFGECLRIWDAEDWCIKHEFPYTNVMWNFAGFDFVEDKTAWTSREKIWVSSVPSWSERDLPFPSGMDSADLIALQPGSTHCVVGQGCTGRMTIIDLNTGQVAGPSVSPYPDNDSPVIARVLPDDPKLLIVQTARGTAHVWDLTSMNSGPVLRWDVGPRDNWNYPLLDTPRSNPGQFLVGATSIVKVFDVKAPGRPLWEGKAIGWDGFKAGAMHGNVVAASGENQVYVFDTNTPNDRVRGLSGSSSAVVVDGERITRISGDFTVAKYIELPPIDLTSRHPAPLPSEMRIPGPRSKNDISSYRLVGSPIGGYVYGAMDVMMDGKLYSDKLLMNADTGSGSNISIWDAATMKELHRFPNTHRINKGAVDWYNDTVAWVCDVPEPKVCIGNSSTFAQPHEFFFSTISELMSFCLCALMHTTGDPTLLAVGNDKKMVLTDIETGRCIHEITPPAAWGARAMKTVPGLNNVVVVLTGNGTVQAFDLNTGSTQPVKTFIGIDGNLNMLPYLTMPEANCGQFLVAQNNVGLFDFRGRDKPFWKIGQDNELKGVNFTDAGVFANTIALVSDTRQVHFFDVTGANGGPTKKVHTLPVSSGTPFRLGMDYSRVYLATDQLGAPPMGWLVLGVDGK